LDNRILRGFLKIVGLYLSTADIGFNDVNAIDGGEEAAAVEAEEGGNEPNVQCRLFPNNLPVARPLVRMPSSASRASQGQNGPND
jgi:hypothetical protein